MESKRVFFGASSEQCSRALGWLFDRIGLGWEIPGGLNRGKVAGSICDDVYICLLGCAQS